MIVVAAGRLDHAEIVGQVEAVPRRVRRRPSARAQRARRTAPLRSPSSGDETEQAHVCLGWRALADDDDDRWAFAVANQVLGGGTASRLFQEIREERGLAYSVYSYPTSYHDAGALTVYCGTAPKRAREALDVIDGVLDDLVADGPTEREVEVARGYLEGSLVLGLEDSGGRMGRLGRNLVQREEITPIDEHLARLGAVEVGDVRRRSRPRVGWSAQPRCRRPLRRAV